MTSSISSTTVIDLQSFYGVTGRRLVKGLTTTPEQEATAHRAAVRKARHELELKAVEYAAIMLQRHIDVALDPKTDPALAAKLRMQIMERGVGKVRDSESDDGKKGATPGDFVDFLTAISSTFAAKRDELGHTPAPRIEREIPQDLIGDDAATWKLLDDLGGGDHE